MADAIGQLRSRGRSRCHLELSACHLGRLAVIIRRFVVRPTQVHDLVPAGTLTAEAATFLEAAVVSGLNIVVAGGTQAGKTTRD
ncbi:MAG: Flp pilus assembly complex ATPase component TadA [Actinomycetales bacterium]|nr:Flp pilus assembly complex ATPase component TadA [Actinomycetales bacterium]